MGYDLIKNIETCYITLPQLLYYSHIPAMVISLTIGFFVYLKDKKALVNRLLFFISLFFSVWVLLNLITWIGHDSRMIMFSWTFFGILYALIYIASLYFVYVFINKNDISYFKKIIFCFLLLPVIIFSVTKYNLRGFDILNCEAIEGNIYNYYYYGLGLLVFFWILLVSFFGYRKADYKFKKQIIYLTIGIELFLLSFFVSGFLTSYLVEKGIVSDFGLEQYGLFGMTFFMGVLSFMIVKFKTFEIKLIGVQALVYGLIILIGSQFFFIQNRINQILTGITLILAIGFGIFLIKSVKNEVKRKEELQDMMEKLAIANDELRKLDNTKSEFISIASHQLRTPLTSIKGYVSLIIEGTYGKVDSHISDPLNKIYASNERLIQLVEDLLNVSRIESGRMEYQFAKHNLASMLKELYDTFSVIARGRGLYLHLYFPENPLPEIEIDGGKTREVISNLIDNAIKYTRRGGITIKAESLVNPEKNEAVVKVTVSDTGMGVPKTELPYLFSKFSRGKDTSRLHVGGTGLGLYVGKSMIEAQHGKIYVESEGEGKGSKFIVEMPIAQPK